MLALEIIASKRKNKNKGGHFCLILKISISESLYFEWIYEQIDNYFKKQRTMPWLYVFPFASEYSKSVGIDRNFLKECI